MHLKGDERFVYVADHLVGDERFLIQRFLFCDSCFGALALVAVMDRQGHAHPERVIARAARHLCNAAPEIHVGNFLRVLKSNRSISSTLCDLCRFQVWSSGERLVAQIRKREIVDLRIERARRIDLHRPVISAERNSEITQRNFIIPFGIRKVCVELQFLNLKAREVETGNFARLDQFFGVLNDFGEGLLVLLREVQERSVQDHRVELLFQIVG